MNRHYRVQESPSEVRKVSKEIQNTITARFVDVKVDRKAKEIDEMLADFYLKTQVHFVTSGDFAQIVRAVYDDLRQLQKPAPTAERKVRKAYEDSVKQCYRLICSVDAACTNLDARGAKEFHDRVGAALVKIGPLEHLAVSMVSFRERRYQNNDRPGKPRGTYADPVLPAPSRL